MVISSAAVYDDKLYATGVVWGEYLSKVDMHYALKGIYVFYAYVSAVTGLNVSIIEHTVCTAVFLVMTYAAFYLLSKYLFPKDEDKNNRLMFLIILSVLFLFGMYSHYSITFRLFGVI